MRVFIDQNPAPVHSVPALTALLADAIFACPDGIDLRDTPYGLGLFATRDFAAGEVIYRCGWFTVEDAPHDFVTQVQGPSGMREVTITNLHSVRFDAHRIFDVPGCFMNHDCRGNSLPRYVVDDPHAYEEVATRAIAAGEQITCNYLLFDWECDGHVFTCDCGAPGCYGEIRGFAHLDESQQRALAPDVTDEVRLRWLSTRLEAAE
jgi:hypothetical protein